MYGGVRCIWSGSIHHNADGWTENTLARYTASRFAGKERNAPDYDKARLQWGIRLDNKPDIKVSQDENL